VDQVPGEGKTGMSGSMSSRVVDTSAITAFTSGVLESEGVTALLLCLEPGQGVGPCRMDCAVLYYVIQGRGRLQVEDELDASSLTAGALAMVPPGVERSIVAGERMRVLAVQIHPAQRRNA